MKDPDTSVVYILLFNLCSQNLVEFPGLICNQWDDTWLSPRPKTLKVLPARSSRHVPKRPFSSANIQPQSASCAGAPDTIYQKRWLQGVQAKEKMVDCHEVLRAVRQTDCCASQPHSSTPQNNHTDPIQRQASAAYTCSVCFCVCGRWNVCACVCWRLCLSLTLIIPLLEQSPLRSPFFFWPQIPFIRISRPAPVVVHRGCCVSPTLVCTFVTAHITAGPCVCLVRGFQFPYITLWTMVLSDFGLHNCVSHYVSLIQRISGLAQADTEHHTLLKLAEVQASFPGLEGKQVYGFCGELELHSCTDACSACNCCSLTDTLSGIVPKYRPIFVLKYGWNNSSGAR